MRPSSRQCVLATALASRLACADTTITTAITSDFESHGETQTSDHPAVQVTLDAREAAGWHVGVFMSNVDFGPSAEFGDPRLELKPSVGYSIPTISGTTYDLGLKYQAYMKDGGSAYNYGSLYLSASTPLARSAIAFAPNYDGRSASQHLPAAYWSADLNIPIGGGVFMQNHIGYSFGRYWEHLAGGNLWDYSAGVLCPIRELQFTLQYVGRANSENYPDMFRNNKGRVVFSIQKSFSI